MISKIVVLSVNPNFAQTDLLLHCCAKKKYFCIYFLVYFMFDFFSQFLSYYYNFIQGSLYGNSLQ